MIDENTLPDISFGRHDTAHCFKITGIALLLLLSGATTLFAQPQWRYEGTPDAFRQAFIEQKSTVLGSNCSTRLAFHATRDQGKGRTGAIALELAVAPYSSIKGFDFEYFEGMDAPVGIQKLMRVTVTRGSKTFVHKLTLGGWLGSEYLEDAFVFESTQLTRNRQGEIRNILNQLLQGADRIEVAVIDGTNHARVLSVTFPLTDSRPAIEKLLKGL